jgi:hypothetical protein
MATIVRGKTTMVRSHNLAELEALYARADALLEGWSCDRSTTCCRFGETGREPQLWPNEWALLSRALAARGGRVAGRRSLPVAGDRPCPLLDASGACTVYTARPFGCRSYFCDRAQGPARRPPRAELAEIGRLIAAAAERVEPGVGPRALTRLVARREPP